MPVMRLCFMIITFVYSNCGKSFLTKAFSKPSVFQAARSNDVEEDLRYQTLSLLIYLFRLENIAIKRFDQVDHHREKTVSRDWAILSLMNKSK